jgi:hypothetical protein
MRDHGRLLGTLFMAYALAQLVATGVTFAGLPPQTRAQVFTGLGALAVGLTLLAVGVYLWAGRRLRAGDPRVRTLAIVLAGLALPNVPLGTALGFYGLWVMLRPNAPARAH